jgi:hypothetical protein
MWRSSALAGRPDELLLVIIYAVPVGFVPLAVPDMYHDCQSNLHQTQPMASIQSIINEVAKTAALL